MPVNNALIYDKYIEIKGYDSSGNSNFMPLPDPNTEQLVIPTDKTFKERKKIYWVENELGWNKNYTKLEFKGLIPNNCYSINCFTEQCINENNPKENVFNKIEDTDNFIFFEYGVNDIKVISKNAKVVFMHKNKYIIDEE